MQPNLKKKATQSKNGQKGVPWWLSELRIQDWYCWGLGCCCGAGLIPGLGTFECCRHSQRGEGAEDLNTHFSKDTDGQQAQEKMFNITNHQRNVNQTTRYHLAPVRMAIIKSLQITNAEEHAEKRKHLYTVGRNVNWCSHYGKWYMCSTKK